MQSIFIQIASYRDPELIPTIDDLLSNADNPDALTICIAHQHSEEDKWDTLDKYANDGRFIIIDIPHTESQGACWARNQIQQHYNGEKYTLQLDSHHRFVKGWDTICIDMLEGLKSKGHDKPLLTSYISSYNPKKDPEDRQKMPWGMSFDKFTPEGIVFFIPQHIDKKVDKPIKARFYSAHFAFTLGQFCKEVQHDPNIYFHGEEITIAVRAFTHGYDMFHPHKIIAWHEYTREGRSKHWDDHKSWTYKNDLAHARTRLLLGVDGAACTPCNEKSLNGYNLGTTRTLKDYETYAGIRFLDRSITEACFNNILPPGSKEDAFLPNFKQVFRFDSNHFKLTDYRFAAFILKDAKGFEVYRKDYHNFKDMINNPIIEVNVNISTPKYWILWAYSETAEWAERLDGVV